MDYNIGHQQQHHFMNNLQQTLATVVTETVAAVMAPSMDSGEADHITTATTTASSATALVIGDGHGNSSFSSHNLNDISTAGLIYWSGDGDGGGGEAAIDANLRDLSNHGDISNSESGAFSLEGSSNDVFINGIVNSFDYSNGSLYPYDTNSSLFMNHCQNMDRNVTYMNVSCDNTLDYVVPLNGYCMPILLIITVLSNSLIVLILSKKNMLTPTNYVLMVMAICDMLTVIFPAPGIIYMFTLGNHYKPLHPVSLCLTYNIFNEVVPAMCHTASIWLTLALAVQRYIYVCHAPMARTWCTIPRVKRCTLYIVIAAFLHQCTRFFDRTYTPIEIEWNGEIVEVCNIKDAHWVSYIGDDYYYTVFFLFRVLFVHLFPCIILVTLNILLFAAMRRAQERRKLLFHENRKKESKKLRETNCTTLMLIVVVTVFLIVEIPICIVTALHIVSSLTTNFIDYQVANLFITFTNFFLVVSYPINFGIYCGMSRQFRETFKEIFLGNMLVKKDNSSRYSMVNGPRTCTNTNETVL